MFGSSVRIVNRWRRSRLTRRGVLSRALSRALAATLFPPRCCLCGFRGASLDLDLCGYCRADLPWSEPRSGGDLFALQYEYPVDEMIRRLKYQGFIANARVLGVLLAQCAQERGAPLPKMLVPVPLHVSRLRERGFNQAAALARYASRILEIPSMRRAVRRTRNTPSQTSLDMAQRHLNVRGAFAVSGERSLRRLLEAGHVAIVDDVITTGSTANELRAVLYAAGVSQVDVWAVAQATPQRRSQSRAIPKSQQPRQNEAANSGHEPGFE